MMSKIVKFSNPFEKFGNLKRFKKFWKFSEISLLLTAGITLQNLVLSHIRLQCRIAGRTSSLAWRSKLRTATTLSTRPLPMARGVLMGAGCFPTPIGWRQFSGSRDTLPSSDTRDSDKTPAKTSGWTSAQTKSTQWDGAPQKENHSYHQRVRSQVWILKNDLDLKRSICPSFLASLFLQLSKQSKTTGRISLSKD